MSACRSSLRQRAARVPPSGQGVRAELADQHGFRRRGGGEGSCEPCEVRIVPAEIFVEADDVEARFEGVPDAPVLRRAGRRDETGRIYLAGEPDEPAEEAGALRRVRRLVADAPQDHARPVAVPADQLGELVFRVRVGVLGREVDVPVDRDLLPEQEAFLVGDPGRAVVVRVVGEAQEVGVEGARVPEAAADVLLRRRLAQHHVVLVDADAPQEQRFSIEEKLAPDGADLAETDPVDHLVRAEAGHDRVKLRRGGRPEDRGDGDHGGAGAGGDRHPDDEVEFGHAHHGLAVYGIGQPDLGQHGAAGAVRHERKAGFTDEDRREPHEADLPIEPAIVEPIEPHGRDAGGEPPVVDRDLEPVAAARQRLRELDAEGVEPPRWRPSGRPFRKTRAS